MERDKSFFSQIAQFEGKVGAFKVLMPLFYYDFSAFSVIYTASYKEVVKLLPSPRLKPYRILPGRALVGLAAFSYRDTDVGPYNEFAVAIPVNVDTPAYVPAASIIQGAAHPTAFISHLPVTTEIANVAGRELYNFPKFVASIDFEQGDDETAVQISEGDKHILTLTIPAMRGKKDIQRRLNLLTARSDKILRCETIVDAHDAAFSYGLRGVKLSLGKDHFMAKDLAALKLGRPMGVVYMPRNQMILTNPLEAYTVMKT